MAIEVTARGASITALAPRRVFHEEVVVVAGCVVFVVVCGAVVGETHGVSLQAWSLMECDVFTDAIFAF